MNPVGVVLFPILLFAQALPGLDAPPKACGHFEKGTITKIGGYTAPGFLCREPDDVLGKAVRFTQDSTLQSEPTSFYPTDLEGFFFERDSATFEAVDYSLPKDTVELKEKRFAKKLVHGYASLYRLQLPEDERGAAARNANVRVYIIRVDGEDNVLRETEKANRANNPFVKKYIGTLRYLFKDCPAVQAKLFDLSFNDDAMASIVKRYCACARPNKNTLAARHTATLRFFHEPEAGFSFFKFGAWAQIYSFGYLLEAVYPEMSENISLMVGLKFNCLVQKGEKNVNGFEIPILIGYNFGNDKIRPFVNYGANLHYFHFDRFYPLWLNSLRAGITLYGVKIVGQLEASNIVDMVKTGQLKIYTIGLGYEF
jgi:hypothetical protein